MSKYLTINGKIVQVNGKLIDVASLVEAEDLVDELSEQVSKLSMLEETAQNLLVADNSGYTNDEINELLAKKPINITYNMDEGSVAFNSNNSNIELGIDPYKYYVKLECLEIGIDDSDYENLFLEYTSSYNSGFTNKYQFTNSNRTIIITTVENEESGVITTTLEHKVKEDTYTKAEIDNLITGALGADY